MRESYVTHYEYIPSFHLNPYTIISYLLKSLCGNFHVSRQIVLYLNKLVVLSTSNPRVHHTKRDSEKLSDQPGTSETIRRQDQTAGGEDHISRKEDAVPDIRIKEGKLRRLPD
jgi:hypothetical protein